MENIRLTASEVVPNLRSIWDDAGWQDRWWPQPLAERRMPATVRWG
jgi:hypothetical protein